jgi:hypothetical protein
MRMRAIEERERAKEMEQERYEAEQRQRQVGAVWRWAWLATLFASSRPLNSLPLPLHLFSLCTCLPLYLSIYPSLQLFNLHHSTSPPFCRSTSSPLHHFTSSPLHLSTLLT